MMKTRISATKKWGLTLGCFILIPWSLMAQSRDGHLIESIDFSIKEQVMVLAVKGVLSPVLFPQIKVVQSQQDPYRTLLSIPHAIKNDKNLAGLVSFAPNDLLVSAEVKEFISPVGQEGVFEMVEISLTSSSPIEVRLEPNQASPEQVSFSVVPAAQEQEVVQRDISTTSDVSSLDQQKLANLLKQGSSLPKSEGSQLEIEPEILHPVAAMLFYQRPKQVRVSVLNASSRIDSARKVAIYLDRYVRTSLEDDLGMRVDVANISSVREQRLLSRTKIYFRPNFLSAALAMAEMIPGEQTVEEMPHIRRIKIGVDVEVFVGENVQ